jgi:ferric-dicitrate binding protein FerR (iron transport regulator)
MTEPHETSDEQPMSDLSTSANGASEAQPAPARRRRSRRRHVLAGAVVAAVLAGGLLRLVPSGQAAPTSGQGAASTACAAK